MTPKGPYVSPWTVSGHYLIAVKRNGKEAYAVLPNYMQPRDATLIFPTIREARRWLKDNGFKIKGVGE